MIQQVSVQPRQIRSYQELSISSPGPLQGFPLLSIDTSSYIVQAEIQSGINFEPSAGRHCIAIGKGCSLADKITFMIDLNHNYSGVVQGEWAFMQDAASVSAIRRKATIIIQNDVWIGHGATIMAGVTLHNGCVVAAGAVVTKDVPPYTIVGGNPARVLRRRFDEETAMALQKIAWWDWPEQTQRARKKDFCLPAQEFAEKYLPDRSTVTPPPPGGVGGRKLVLFIPDVEAAHPLYPQILKQYLAKDRPHMELLIYLPKKVSDRRHQGDIEAILERSVDRDCYITLQTGTDLDEHMLFQMADHFITTRCRETVRRSCLADLYGVKLLYGTDDPIFPEDLMEYTHSGPPG